MRSRANSLKHGLCSTVVVHPEDASRLAVGPAAAPASPPAGEGLEGWLRGQVALATLKVERCQEMERAVRSRVMLRAELTWDDDRRLEAIELASKLASRPEEVAARLQESFQGCDWMLGRWAMLACAADSRDGAWSPEQTALAFDLLGTPHEFREGHPPGTRIDALGRRVEPNIGPAAVARLAIDELQARLELLRPIEALARDRAEADLADDDPELRRLRRYEAELFRRIHWALGRAPEATPPVEVPPAPEAESGPASEPIPPRQAPSVTPAPQPSRADRRLSKAESRREARRRKLDRLLA